MRVAGEEVLWNSIHDLLQARALEHADAPLVEVAGTITSWGELKRAADRMASALAAAGIGPGDRVCSMMDGRVEQLVVWFGTSKLGAVWVPLNTGLVGDDLQYTVRDAAPKALFVEAETATRFDDWPTDAPLPAAPICADSSPRFERWSGFTNATGEVRPARVGPKNPGVIIYTGGTTGRPKGVVMPHFAFLARLPLSRRVRRRA